MRTLSLVLLLGVLLSFGIGVAQTPESLRPFAPIIQPTAELGSSSFPALPLQLGPDARGEPSWQNRILTALGGALVGMGLGYFVSQLFTSDWSEELEGQAVDRGAWVAVGGSLGFAVGFAFPITGASGPPGPRSLGGSRGVISAAEILEITAVNAFEAVRLLRPEWLIPRGQDATARPTDDDIRVYLDEAELGGVDALSQVGVELIRSIRFIDAAHATARWGAGHSQGVIQILTMD